ncbi:MAG: Uma2 family endonuclease [Dysgonamonadaceae bacterium]|jgi:Uma2 family endonuclease|nr:Uma2 family endonuclease [Dysgonamonadaceae bacterium]
METKNKPYPTREEWDEQGGLALKEPPSVYGLANPAHYTYADYLSWMDDTRRELYNGVVHNLFSTPTVLHARLSSLIQAMMTWFFMRRKAKCKVFHAPFDVRLPKNGETADNKIFTVVQPDICVVCDPNKLDEKGCIGAPDLIVEVQSLSTGKRDLNDKFHLYEEAGVREYWVVFPKEGISVFLLQETGKYDDGSVYELREKVQSSIFKGLEIDLEKLFEE